MVGNGSWHYPNRRVGDYSRIETIKRAWFPVWTNKGPRWLVLVRRVSTIESSWDPKEGTSIWDFLGLTSCSEQEVIRYEVLT